MTRRSPEERDRVRAARIRRVIDRVELESTLATIRAAAHQRLQTIQIGRAARRDRQRKSPTGRTGRPRKPLTPAQEIALLVLLQRPGTRSLRRMARDLGMPETSVRRVLEQGRMDEGTAPLEAATLVRANTSPDSPREMWKELRPVQGADQARELAVSRVLWVLERAPHLSHHALATIALEYDEAAFARWRRYIDRQLEYRNTKSLRWRAGKVWEEHVRKTMLQRALTEHVLHSGVLEKLGEGAPKVAPPRQDHPDFRRGVAGVSSVEDGRARRGR